MTSATLKGSGKQRTVKKSQHQLTWSFDMRQTVHILRTEFQLPGSAQARIFSDIYRHLVQRCGFAGDVPFIRLAAQWHDKRPRDWKLILAPVVTVEEQMQRDTARSEIMKAAQSLGILLPDSRQQQQHLPPQPPPPLQQRAITHQTFTPPTSQPTQLSRRAPVGFWDPDLEESDEEQEDSQPNRQRTARVATSQRTLIIKQPRTKRTPRSPKGPRNVAYPRPDDQARGLKPLLLTPEEYKRTLGDLTPVEEHLAHPGVPPLLFRWFHQDDGPEYHNLFTENDGFIARKFSDTVRLYQRPPGFNELCWTDLYKHIDRIEEPSPFVSTSNAFWWILRLAVKERSNEIRTGCISVIDGTKLDQRSVYHIHPYWRKLKDKYVFHNGAWRYGGSTEFIVHREIPRDAIINTFSVEELCAWVDSDSAIKQTLRLDLLGLPGDFRKKIIPLFRENSNLLTTAVAEVIAELANFIGLDAGATVDQLSHLVTNVVQGWGLVLDRKNGGEWREIARAFAHAHSNHFDFSSEMELMFAFLDGVRYASSKEFNTKHTTQAMARMQKQAKSIGLENVAQVLSAEMDAVKIRLFIQEHKKDRLLGCIGPPMTVVGEAGDEVALRRSRAQIMIAESDGIEPDSGQYDDEDEDEVFEFGTDGLVTADSARTARRDGG